MKKKTEAQDPQKDADTLPYNWESRLKRMREYQREQSADWVSNERLLTGDTTGVEAEGISKGTGAKARGLAYGWGLVRSLLSEIYAQNPQVLAEPFSQDLYQHARLMTRIAQSDLDNMDAEEALQDAITDSFPCGYGAVIEAVDNIKTSRIDPDTQESLDVLEGQTFTLRRIHPNDILFDPSGRLFDLSDQRWIAVRFYPTIQWLREQAKKTPGWRLPTNLDESPEAVPETKGDNRLEKTTSSLGSGTHQETEPEFRQVAVLEIHDKTRHKILYVLEHSSFFMYEKDWPFRLQIEGKTYFPITLVAFNKRTTGFYPVPELTLVRPQLLELSNLARLMREDSGNKFRKIATLAEFLDPVQKAELADQTKPLNLLAFDRKAVEEFFGEENVGREFDVRRLVQMLDDVQANRDHPLRYAMVEAEIQHILGYGPSNRGGMPKVRSAREAVIINDANQGKLQTKLGRIEKCFRLIAQKHILIVQQMQAMERYARNFPEVADLEPFLSYTKEQIQGEFAFRVFAGSSAPRNTETRKAQTREMFQTMGPVLQNAGYDLRPLIELVAKAHGWDEVDMLFKNVRQEMLALAAISFAVQKQQAPPEKLIEAVARVVQAGLSPAELQALAAKLGGGGPAAPGQVPPPAPGEMRGDPDALGTQTGVF